jgi:hypothetical protein
VSSLWTPEGEHRVRPADDSGGSSDDPRPPSGGAGAGAGGDARDVIDPDDAGLDDLGPEEQAELASRLNELRRQLLGTPAEVVVANHAYGLFELAAIHLSQRPPQREEARLAVDAMAALVEGLAGRLGDAERSLKDALAQIRLAFVQISESVGAEDGEGSESGP